MFPKKVRWTNAMLISMSVFLSGCGWYNTNTVNIGDMKITSPVFLEAEMIPPEYTCDGTDQSPPLVMSDVPAGTQSLALIVDDPDAPAGTWVHWTVWNIEPTVREIAVGTVPAGATEGQTSFGSAGYGGPCPPSGVHRYYFKLYALDAKLNLPAGGSLSALETAMSGHKLAEAMLMGRYSRNK